MRFTSAPLADAVVIDLEPHTDERGAFARTFCVEEFREHGLPTDFPQCNLSYNCAAGTLRGMHYNCATLGESKLVRCVRGAIYDVIVDLRADSPTQWKWFAIELTAMNARALLIPIGFAHGFLTLEDGCDIHYHMGTVFRPEASRGFRWNDPSIAIEWPDTPSVVSEHDSGYGDLDLATFDLGD